MPNSLSPPVQPKFASTSEAAAKLVKQFGKYLVVGGIAFVVDFATLVACTEWVGLHYLLAATLGFGIGLITNYFLSIVWVFSERSLSNWKIEFFVFGIIGIAGLAMTGLMMWAGTDVAGIDYRICKVATVFVVTAWNFGLRRILLFGGPAL